MEWESPFSSADGEVIRKFGQDILSLRAVPGRWGLLVTDASPKNLETLRAALKRNYTNLETRISSREGEFGLYVRAKKSSQQNNCLPVEPQVIGIPSRIDSVDSYRKILFELTQSPPVPVGWRTTDLARKTKLTYSSVGTAVGRLVVLGLVSRYNNPYDRRSTIIRLTDLGQSKLETMVNQ